MKITKIYHSCILLEENDAKILIDPGHWVFEHTDAKPSDFSDVNAVLITHEHPDHFYPEALDEIRSSGARIITNKSLAPKIREKGMKADMLNPGEVTDVSGISVKAADCPHGILPVPVPENVGFVIQDKIFHPGDCTTIRGIQCDILITPCAAPWMRTIEGVKFAKSVRPKIAIPVHEGFMRDSFASRIRDIFEKVVSESRIEIKAKNPGESFEI
ncbi:MAG: MBL fold metallo-hydrolase [Candidatus Aenigmarchaeota archaeon]|nr:MBL fold metallo-hydrolase [Candidatus Aenigmarchaeota archaeon]